MLNFNESVYGSIINVLIVVLIVDCFEILFIPSHVQMHDTHSLVENLVVCFIFGEKTPFEKIKKYQQKQC